MIRLRRHYARAGQIAQEYRTESCGKIEEELRKFKSAKKFLDKPKSRSMSRLRHYDL
jgi:hypothetical protein